MRDSFLFATKPLKPNQTEGVLDIKIYARNVEGHGPWGNGAWRLFLGGDEVQFLDRGTWLYPKIGYECRYNWNYSILV